MLFTALIAREQLPDMITSPIAYFLIAFIIGAGLGILYFKGLMWTLKNLPRAKRSGLCLTISFWLRSGIAVTCFYIIMAGDWKRLLVSLTGFMLVRILMVRQVKVNL